MDITHHFLSGFKSLFTEWTYEGMENSRIACGGAGFLKASGFAELQNFYSPMPTFEGDNTVMLQQSARYLFKLLKKSGKGKKIEAPFEYINEIDGLLSTNCVCLGITPEHFLDLNNLDEAFKVKTAFLCKTVSTAYNASKEPEKEKANDIFAAEVNEMAKTHLKYVAFHIYISKIREGKFKDHKILPIMELVGKVFALNELTTDCQQCFASGYFGEKTTYNSLHEAYKLALN